MGSGQHASPLRSATGLARPADRPSQVGRRSSIKPRVVVVKRPTAYELLLARHGTREQARFFLSTRGQDLEDVEAAHAAVDAALRAISRAIPTDWRRSSVARADVSRFVFEPADVIVAVGQDGLVANVARYLHGQPVIGVNPDPARWDGILVCHLASDAAGLLGPVVAGRAVCEERTMVEITLDDGQRLRAVNEIFVGHRSHQSARYSIRLENHEERHSSSGVIVATGTGATGWARSIHRQRRCDVELPAPEDPMLAFFVREAWPSVITGTDLTHGQLRGEDTLELRSEMNDGGVVFGDGIEQDRLDFRWGMNARIGISDTRLRLVRGAT